MVIEFRFFNLNKKNKKYEELQYCIFAKISYHNYTTYFHQFLIRVPFSSILNTFFKCEMKCIVKVKTRIFKCTGLMPSDLGNPYIHSATALFDRQSEPLREQYAYVYMAAQKLMSHQILKVK